MSNRPLSQSISPGNQSNQYSRVPYAGQQNIGQQYPSSSNLYFPRSDSLRKRAREEKSSLPDLRPLVNAQLEQRNFFTERPSKKIKTESCQREYPEHKITVPPPSSFPLTTIDFDQKNSVFPIEQKVQSPLPTDNEDYSIDFFDTTDSSPQHSVAIKAFIYLISFLLEQKQYDRIQHLIETEAVFDFQNLPSDDRAHLYVYLTNLYAIKNNFDIALQSVLKGLSIENITFLVKVKLLYAHAFVLYKQNKPSEAKSVAENALRLDDLQKKSKAKFHILLYMIYKLENMSHHAHLSLLLALQCSKPLPEDDKVRQIINHLARTSGLPTSLP